MLTLLIMQIKKKEILLVVSLFRKVLNFLIGFLFIKMLKMSKVNQVVGILVTGLM